MKVQDETKPYDTINVTPMLDLAYVLLVVFILMTTASVQGLNVSMPKPSNKPVTEQHDLRIVQVLADGGVTVNGVGVSLSELEGQLGQAKAADPKMTVAIKGDAKAHYDKVVAVIDLCNKLEVNMALVTTRIGT
ncbi:biopolymer transporter ExbD [Aquabacterium sp. CECT 9606]|uniref:ExbD/TolR family protein n=1 Tax=Aquabacterium sp. CECT 9606 TaxID=2845822 RepID=UPI001E5C03C0|nr:biopolymer transporter ExbD [Aquabacterium sp. CECT 9606]CAH0351555.1 Tol-Pal system protein TolR [Aquabacterium sp. CECT 9606]